MFNKTVKPRKSQDDLKVDRVEVVEKGKRLLGISGLLVVGFVVLSLVLSSLVTVQDGNVGVVRRFGQITHLLQPGIHLTIPFAENVQIVNTQIRETNLNFSTITADTQNVYGVISLQYMVNAGQAESLARNFQTVENMENMINAMFNQQILNTMTARTTEYLVANTGLIETELRERITPLMDGFYAVLVNIALESITFDPSFMAAVNDRIVATQIQERVAIEVETQRIQAELQLEVASLQAQAVVLAAQAEADAVAAMMAVWYDDSAPEAREFAIMQKTIEQWNGVLPQIVTSGDFGAILGAFH